MVIESEQSVTEEEKVQIFALLLQYHTIFATTLFATNTGEAFPIRQSVRHMPQLQRKEAKKLLSDMLTRAVIQPSSSPWASPVVLVPKKDGSFHFCINYRNVNTITRTDAYPLPCVDDTLDTLAGSKWFSTLKNGLSTSFQNSLESQIPATFCETPEKLTVHLISELP